MPIKFRQPQDINAIRFGATLVWGIINGAITTIIGASPLALVNALAKPIKSLIQTGKCVQNSTPTPDAPVDLVCNNGAVKWGVSGTNLLDMAEENIRLRYYINDSGAEASNNQNFYNTKFIPVKPNTTYTLSASEPVYYTSIMEYDSNKGFLQRTLDGSSSEKHSSTTITTRADAAYILIGSNPNRTALSMDDVTSINWMFNEGSTVLPYEPYTEGIITDGTPEVLSVGGKNLLKMPTFDEVTNSSQVANYWNIPIKLEPNTTYYVSSHYLNDYTSLDKNLYVLITANATANKDFATIAHKTVGIRDRELTTDNSGYLYFRVNRAARELYEEMLANMEAQLELGSAATSYEPYREPQTATVANLFAVGDYADTQDIISGAVNRKVGVKVLNGTETWGQKNATDGRIIMRLNDAINQASAPIIVTHGQWSTSAAKDSDEWRILAGPYLCCYSSLETTADFKAYLAAQYAQGTPVIVMYPLAEETIENVTPQPMRTTEGSNTVSVTSAVDPVQLEIDYYKDE